MTMSHKIAIRLCGFAGISLLAVAYGPLAIEDLAAAYPKDVDRAAALDKCAAAIPTFDRLDQSERATCYATHLANAAGLNEIDLRNSAGRGRQPQNDVMQQQQLDRYFEARTTPPTR